MNAKSVVIVAEETKFARIQKAPISVFAFRVLALLDTENKAINVLVSRKPLTPHMFDEIN